MDATLKPSRSTVAIQPFDSVGGLGTSLLSYFDEAGRFPLIYVARDAVRASAVARVLGQLDPDRRFAVLPAWDSLPYDRRVPSSAAMGTRIGVLHWLADLVSPPHVVFTTPPALLRLVPPRAALRDMRITFRVGDALDPEAVEADLQRIGYTLDERVDVPGEAAVRGRVIDIFPAAASMPCRIEHEAGAIVSIRSYGPMTQRSEVETEFLLIDAASEMMPLADAAASVVPEELLLDGYAALESVLDHAPSALLVLEDGAEESAEAFFEQVQEGFETTQELNALDRGRRRVPDPADVFLCKATWSKAVADKTVAHVKEGSGPERFPLFMEEPDPDRALARFVGQCFGKGQRVVLAGADLAHKTLVRRAERALSRKATRVSRWSEAAGAPAGSLLALSISIDAGFISPDQDTVVVAAADLLGKAQVRASAGADADPAAVLFEGLDLRIGSAVVHEDHGIGRLEGLEEVAIEKGGHQEVVRLAYAGGATLMVPTDEMAVLWPYGAQAKTVRLDRLDSKHWRERRERLEEEIEASAAAMAAKLRERDAKSAPRIVAEPAVYERFVRRFPHPLTSDQESAVSAVLADMSMTRPMDRIICGDVGYGKTEVALRAAAACLFAGKQVAIAAPTTVLVRQHLDTFRRRFGRFDIEIAQLSRLLPASEAKSVRQRLATGEVRLVIGTHALSAGDVHIPELGLMVIDEEQRFGKRQKEALRQLSPSSHLLTLTATPIPRTLRAGMIGLKDVSVIASPPAERQSVRTFLSDFDAETVRKALKREVRHGGQSFVVCPRIEDMEPMAKRLRELAPGLDLRTAHGKMPAKDIDSVMAAFAKGEGDVLLSTNIVESGLDVPCANTIMIWHADRFGLAQLHQLRGRVGRGTRRGVAFLLTEPGRKLSAETEDRLRTIASLYQLGAGFEISKKDLELRGAGDLFGEEQTGHIEKIGLGLYRHLFDQALRTARGELLDDVWSPEINLDLNAGIPVDYIPEAEVRLNIHAVLARLSTMRRLQALEAEIVDRFGPLPERVENLLTVTMLRARCRPLGIARLNGGPRALAASFRANRHHELADRVLKAPLRWREDRLIFERTSRSSGELLASASEFIDRVTDAIDATGEPDPARVSR